jgi:hypothetical protein
MCGQNEGCCNGQCIPLNTDDNCGACNNKCLVTMHCKQGQCQCDSPNLTWCGDEGIPGYPGIAGCVDLQTNRQHCGQCADNWCTGTQMCVHGACKNSCAPFTDCGSGICRDTTTDSANCGQCNHVCDSNQQCVNGQCKCITPCGADCCPPGKVCQNGQCVCPVGLEACGEVCCLPDTCCDDRCMLSPDDTCCHRGDGSTCSDPDICCDDGISCASSLEDCPHK